MFSSSVLIYDIEEKVFVYEDTEIKAHDESEEVDDKFSILLWAHVRRICI